MIKTALHQLVRRKQGAQKIEEWHQLITKHQHQLVLMTTLTKIRLKIRFIGPMGTYSNASLLLMMMHRGILLPQRKTKIKTRKINKTRSVVTTTMVMMVKFLLLVRSQRRLVTIKMMKMLPPRRHRHHVDHPRCIHRLETVAAEGKTKAAEKRQTLIGVII